MLLRRAITDAATVRHLVGEQRSDLGTRNGEHRPGLPDDEVDLQMTAEESHGLRELLHGRRVERRGLLVQSRFLPEPIGARAIHLGGGRAFRLERALRGAL
jgi:hypothetical protein